MQRAFFGNPKVIIVLLAIQFIPLLLFPAYVFSPTSQQWWLPVILSLLALWGLIDLLMRGGSNPAPWNLISFAHGFNIISRLMMLLPHATRIVDGAPTFNAPYVATSLIAMVWSALMLMYVEKPEARLGLVKKQTGNR